MGKSRNSFIVASIFIYMLVSLPFLFGATLLGNHTLPIKLMVVLVLFPQAVKYHTTNKTVITYLSVFIFYSLILCLLRTNYIINTVLLVVDVTFFWECIKLLGNNDIYFRIRKRYLQFSILIAGLIILSSIVYKFFPSLYSYQEINGYKSFFNPFLGLINGEKERPCWFFAESSYCGFYLGVSFFLLYADFNYKKLRKLLLITLFAFAIYFTASLGTYIYIVLTLLASIFARCFKNKLLLELILYASILFVLFIIPQIDELQLLLGYETDNTSFLDRQERIINAKSIMDNMTIVDKLFGCGINYATEKFKIGLSDAYHKMYCEYGLVYLILFLAVVRKTTVNYFTAYTFILLSFFSVIIHDSPIMLLSYYLIFKHTDRTSIVKTIHKVYD